MPPPIPATLKSLVFPPSRHHPPPPLLLIYGKKQNRAINYSRCRPTSTLLLTKAAGETSSKIWWTRPRSTPHEAEGLLRTWTSGWAGERQSGGNNAEGDSVRAGATGSLQQSQSEEGEAGLNGGDKERDQKDGLLTLPTILTLGRVAAVPLIVSTFYMTGWWASTATTGIFVAAAITDWLDGYIARKMQLRTTFGAFLDPGAVLLLLTLSFPSFSYGWGKDGHLIVCQIAQGRLSDAAAEAVKELLPDYANGDLSSLCSWADDVKFRYKWSSPLHYIDTPDKLCTYNYNRDCKNENGEPGMCVSGAINNYTNQLLTKGNYYNQGQHNLTQALLFLSHFIGDIHQPLHVSFTSDRGGNTIDVHWYTIKTNLHHVWDNSIIETAEEAYYNTNVENLVDALRLNMMKGDWASKVSTWEQCSSNQTVCPDIYATESISAACEWAYKYVNEDSMLEDDYFQTRLPVVNLRLAEAGVRLAATLNRIFT